MLLQELETQLLALSPSEKAEAIRLLTPSLNNRKKSGSLNYGAYLDRVRSNNHNKIRW